LRFRTPALIALVLVGAGLWRTGPTVRADGLYQALPFTQDWSNASLITTTDSWTGVPGIIGCRGDGLTSATAVDPQTVLAADDSCVQDVNANNASVAFATGGVTEFAIANPVVALQGSGTARAPYLLIHVNTLGKSNIRVSYNLRDIDSTTDNSVQPVALQYRVGATGNFINLPGGFVADASTGPSLATLVTPISVMLPAAAENQAQVQIRIITTDAPGSDEWIGIDDIQIAETFSPSGSGLATPSTVEQGLSSLLTVAVTPGTNPVSTGLGVTANLTAIGGAASQPFFDNGTNGDVTAGDNVFSFAATVPAATSPGAKLLPAVITDAQGRMGSANIGLTVTAAPLTLSIPAIQGPGTASPYLGQAARTTGIVTARLGDGFFAQGASDGDPLTSEGIFVFTAGAPPAVAAVGNSVQVTGTVAEFRRNDFPNRPSLTELVSPAVTLLSTGNPLPAARELTAADLTPAGGIGQLERFEGMRVSFAGLTAISATGGSVNETDASGGNNGRFFAVITGTPRPFREPGIEIGDPDPAVPFPGIPRFDGNPERLLVDSAAQSGVAAIVTSGAQMTNVSGILHYDFGEYRVLPDAPLSPTGNIAAVPVPAAQPGELKIASFNLQRFYDSVNDAGVSDAVPSPAAVARRLRKASLAIRDILGSPDVLAVMEMENLAVLQALAARINSDAAAAGLPNPGYQACLEEGNDVGGIDVGFLYSTRVTVTECAQFGKDATYIDPNTGLPAILNDRPPLALRGQAATPGSDTPYSFTVVANHLRSLNDIDDPASGNRVRTKRLAQANFAAALLQDLQDANTISVGDYNAFQFNDGYVDVMGSITGNPAVPGTAFLTGADFVNPNYTNLTNSVSLANGYSFVFAGSAQTLDHVLVNQRVLPRVSRYGVARLNADFPEIYRSDENRPERISDHDVPVVFLRLPVEITSSVAITSSPVNYNPGQQYYMANLQVKNASTAPLPNPFYVVLEGLAPSVILQNATGMTAEGLPYITVDRNLRPNATEVVQLRFAAPAGTEITFTARVYRSL
jgi:uncharacterized protein